MKTINFPSPTKERLENGACKLLEEDEDLVYDKEGIITSGAYKGEKGAILYACRDGSAFHFTVMILSGPDTGAEMCYQGTGWKFLTY